MRSSSQNSGQNGSQNAGRQGFNGEMRPNQEQEQMIRVDGKRQVIDLLRAADPAHREMLLRGIESRDAKLARELRAAL